MTSSFLRFRSLASAIAVSVLLAACGGGDGGGDAPPAQAGPEAWVAGRYVSACFVNSPSGVVGSMDFIAEIDGHGVVSSQTRIFSDNTVCTGPLVAALADPPGQITTVDARGANVPGLGPVTVRRVVVSGPAGTVDVSGDMRYVRVNATDITVLDPNSGNVMYTAARTASAYSDKNLMTSQNGRLYFGDYTALDANDFPLTIDTSYSLARY